MKKRTTRTYTIDDKLYEEFEKIIFKENINKSKLIESMIKDYVKNNFDNKFHTIELKTETIKKYTDLGVCINRIIFSWAANIDYSYIFHVVKSYKYNGVNDILPLRCYDEIDVDKINNSYGIAITPDKNYFRFEYVPFEFEL